VEAIITLSGKAVKDKISQEEAGEEERKAGGWIIV
jgi:hypothetical protein